MEKETKNIAPVDDIVEEPDYPDNIVADEEAYAQAEKLRNTEIKTVYETRERVVQRESKELLDRYASSEGEIKAQAEVIKDKDAEQARQKRKVIIRNIIIIALLFIIVILLLVRCSQEGDPDAPDYVLETSDFIEPEKSAEPTTGSAVMGSIDVHPIDDITISSKVPYLTLSNPETNKDKYYLQFFLYEGDSKEPFYQSNMVEGGKKFSVNLKELLSVGEHEVKYEVKTFKLPNMTPCNGLTQNVTVTVQ